MALIGVYADWEGLDGPERIGYLHSRRTRTREIFEFEYDKKALADPSLNFIQLDPEIMLYEGAQYPIPVSYTHLDVYKRQPGKCSGSRTHG